MALTMADFSNYVNPITKDRTADFTFVNLAGQPRLTVRFAGESNKPYFNEVLRRGEHLQRRKVKVSVDTIQGLRDRDRELYPKFVVMGWPVAPVDKAGSRAPFTVENCEAWLRAIPDEEFDELREFCRDPHQFRDVADGEAASGNSPTA